MILINNCNYRTQMMSVERGEGFSEKHDKTNTIQTNTDTYGQN